MADKAEDYELTNDDTAAPATWNTRFFDINSRLKRLEEKGGRAFSFFIPGVVADGTRYILVPMPVALGNVYVAIACVERPGGGNLVVDVLKGGEPSGGAPGDSIFAVAGDRPTVLSTNTSGASDFMPATAEMPLAAGDILAIDVITAPDAPAGPAEGVTVIIVGEPVA